MGPYHSYPSAKRWKLLRKRFVKPFQSRALIVVEFALQNHMEVDVSGRNGIWEGCRTIDVGSVKFLRKQTPEPISKCLNDGVE